MTTAGKSELLLPKMDIINMMKAISENSHMTSVKSAAYKVFIAGCPPSLRRDIVEEI